MLTQCVEQGNEFAIWFSRALSYRTIHSWDINSSLNNLWLTIEMAIILRSSYFLPGIDLFEWWWYFELLLGVDGADDVSFVGDFLLLATRSWSEKSWNESFIAGSASLSLVSRIWWPFTPNTISTWLTLYFFCFLFVFLKADPIIFLNDFRLTGLGPCPSYASSQSSSVWMCESFWSSSSLITSIVFDGFTWLMGSPSGFAYSTSKGWDLSRWHFAFTNSQSSPI